eukprot:gnl/Chilomastix_cuspidata/943.p1 GENE.gnl/Chilomastix_cuspidata/943~~gnl/Chilomastix_cuspidata/943.p1  ORF type:complete len:1162 (+),score=355.16 gnl/Chilomastix_cuspidata/943:37-3522(+)
MPLFSRKPKETPAETARRWQRSLRGEMRKLDRQIMGIDREERKTKMEIQKAAKNNDAFTCKVLATELVRSRKARERILVTKATINSGIMAIGNQMATLRVSGALKDTTPVLNAMNELVKLPELQKTVMSMSKEFQKAGMMEEMLNEAIDDAVGASEESELADDAVAKVFEEMHILQFAGVGPVGTAKAGDAARAPARAEAEAATSRCAAAESEAEALRAKQDDAEASLAAFDAQARALGADLEQTKRALKGARDEARKAKQLLSRFAANNAATEEKAEKLEEELAALRQELAAAAKQSAAQLGEALANARDAREVGQRCAEALSEGRDNTSPLQEPLNEIHQELARILPGDYKSTVSAFAGISRLVLDADERVLKAEVSAAYMAALLQHCAATALDLRERYFVAACERAAYFRLLTARERREGEAARRKRTSLTILASALVAETKELRDELEAVLSRFRASSEQAKALGRLLDAERRKQSFSRQPSAEALMDAAVALAHGETVSTLLESAGEQILQKAREQAVGTASRRTNALKEFITDEVSHDPISHLAAAKFGREAAEARLCAVVKTIAHLRPLLPPAPLGRQASAAPAPAQDCSEQEEIGLGLRRALANLGFDANSLRADVSFLGPQAKVLFSRQFSAIVHLASIASARAHEPSMRGDAAQLSGIVDTIRQEAKRLAASSIRDAEQTAAALNAELKAAHERLARVPRAPSAPASGPSDVTVTTLVRENALLKGRIQTLEARVTAAKVRLQENALLRKRNKIIESELQKAQGALSQGRREPPDAREPRFCAATQCSQSVRYAAVQVKPRSFPVALQTAMPVGVVAAVQAGEHGAAPFPAPSDSEVLPDAGPSPLPQARPSPAIPSDILVISRSVETASPAREHPGKSELESVQLLAAELEAQREEYTALLLAQREKELAARQEARAATDRLEQAKDIERRAGEMREREQAATEEVRSLRKLLSASQSEVAHLKQKAQTGSKVEAPAVAPLRARIESLEALLGRATREQRRAKRQNASEVKRLFQTLKEQREKREGAEKKLKDTLGRLKEEKAAAKREKDEAARVRDALAKSRELSAELRRRLDASLQEKNTLAAAIRKLEANLERLRARLRELRAENARGAALELQPPPQSVNLSAEEMEQLSHVNMSPADIAAIMGRK